MRGSLFPFRDFRPDAPCRRTSPKTHPPRRASGLRRLGLGVAALAMLYCGCSTTPGPAVGSSGGLNLLNPLAARSKEKAFKQKVENDPFPAASQTGLVATVVENR